MYHTMTQFQDKVRGGAPCALLRDLAENFREVRANRDSSSVPVLHHVYRQDGRYVVEHACDREGCPSFHGWKIPEPDRPLADPSKIRRRVEDRLRKGTNDEIYRVAALLGVPLTP